MSDLIIRCSKRRFDGQCEDDYCSLALIGYRCDDTLNHDGDGVHLMGVLLHMAQRILELERALEKKS